ncbi:MAG TPA: CBS domain-containing protein [Archaeoglobaceae archaeon]|nr:CBS domain-containing protein [Archaeoglobaceae archaeon]
MQSDMPVKEIMTREVCTSKKDVSLLTASRKMIRFGVGSIVVIEDHKALGIVTERDILVKVVAKNKVPSKVKLEDIMSYPLITVTPNTSIREASEIMKKKNIRRLPVVENGDLAGIITDNDILSVSFDLGEMFGLLREHPAPLEELSGKCEKCGKVTDELLEVNGSRLCEDCAELIG